MECLGKDVKCAFKRQDRKLYMSHEKMLQGLGKPDRADICNQGALCTVNLEF